MRFLQVELKNKRKMGVMLHVFQTLVKIIRNKIGIERRFIGEIS